MANCREIDFEEQQLSTPREKEMLKREIAATDRAIDQSVYALGVESCPMVARDSSPRLFLRSRLKATL